MQDIANQKKRKGKLSPELLGRARKAEDDLGTRVPVQERVHHLVWAFSYMRGTPVPNEAGADLVRLILSVGLEVPDGVRAIDSKGETASDTGVPRS